MVIRRKSIMSAFTLLEMLLALAMMSMLATSLYVSLHTGFKARESAEATLAPARAAGIAMELLREDIESALPPRGILAADFVGVDGITDDGEDGDTLVFHSSAHVPEEGERACDVRKTELAIESLDDGTQRALLRKITTNLLAPTVPEPREEVLCRGIRGFNVRYFDGAEWLDSWDSTAQDDVLPSAVEVTLHVDVPGRDPSPSGGYQFTRVFLLQCGGATAGEGTRVIRRTSGR